MTPGPAQLDADRILALSYVPAARRAAVSALWHLDLALGAALAGGREPIIARIKLAWWREALERLDREPPPAEPVLEAVARHLLPAGVAGAELAGMEEGWSAVTGGEAPGEVDLLAYAEGRGSLLFRFTAALLGEPANAATEAAGKAWALVDLARHSSDAGEMEAALATARRFLPAHRWRKRLRPLGMLAMLAARDAQAGRPHWEVPGAPARMLRMLRHRFTGA